MKDPTYYNGVITPFDSAAIPLYDRSVFFGDAIYEVMIGRKKSVYQFEEHTERLRKNCKAIGLRLSVGDGELLDVIRELKSLTESEEFCVYVQVSGNSKRRQHVRTSDDVNVLVTLTEVRIPKTPNKISAILLPDKRYAYCNIKTTNLLPAVLAVNEAVEKGADIAIFERNGEITECSHANIAILKDGILKTPPLDNRILPGITRATLLNICGSIGVPSKEAPLEVNELLSADAILISSTTKLVGIAASIDGKETKIQDENTANRIFDALYKDFLLKTE